MQDVTQSFRISDRKIFGVLWTYVFYTDAKPLHFKSSGFQAFVSSRFRYFHLPIHHASRTIYYVTTNTIMTSILTCS